jgi:hypothetical protein
MLPSKRIRIDSFSADITSDVPRDFLIRSSTKVLLGKSNSLTASHSQANLTVPESWRKESSLAISMCLFSLWLSTEKTILKKQLGGVAACIVGVKPIGPKNGKAETWVGNQEIVQSIIRLQRTPICFHKAGLTNPGCRGPWVWQRANASHLHSPTSRDRRLRIANRRASAQLGFL